MEARIEPLPAHERSHTIGIHSNFVKPLIAVGQLLYACATIYQTRGDQIELYGYSAFGLTVIPYAFMSLVNLFVLVMCPDFQQSYVVESSILIEARNRGGIFNGIVGRLVEEDGSVIRPGPQAEIAFAGLDSLDASVVYTEHLNTGSLSVKLNIPPNPILGIIEKAIAAKLSTFPKVKNTSLGHTASLPELNPPPIKQTGDSRQTPPKQEHTFSILPARDDFSPSADIRDPILFIQHATHSAQKRHPFLTTGAATTTPTRI
jgi:hypothetical protein